MRHAKSEMVVYRAGNIGIERKVRAALRKLIEAPDTDFAAPWSDAKRKEVVNAIRYSEALNHWRKANATGYDEDRRITVDILKRAAKPTQESLDSFGALGIAEHPLEEDGQLIDHQKNPPVVFSAATEQSFSMISPVSCVQFRPDLQAELAHSDFLDGSKHLPSETAPPRDDRAHAVCHSCNVGDHVLGTGCVLDISEEHDPFARLGEPSAKFPCDARLPHTTLPGQQHVVARAHLSIKYPQLPYTVEEVSAAHPAASSRFQGSLLLSTQ